MKQNSFFQSAFAQKANNYAVAAAQHRRLRNFSTGEVHRPASGKVLAAMRTIDPEQLIEYPDPVCREVKRAIAKRYRVSQAMITVGNGSDEIIENIPRVFLEPGDPCLFVVPTFFRFIESCRRMKARIVTVPTREEDRFMLTPQLLSEVIDAIRTHRPAIVWLDSPNSVTGAVIEEKFIEHIVTQSPGLVVVDEVHHELVDSANRRSTIKLLSKHKNLVVVKSVSKAFGLAGVRFGFALAHRNIIRSIEQWRLTFAVNAISQKAAIAALGDKTHVKKVSESVRKQRERLFSDIEKIPGMIIGAPSQTHLFILKHERLNLFEELRKRGILAADLNHVPGLELTNFVRLNIKSGPEAQHLRKALVGIYFDFRTRYE